MSRSPLFQFFLLLPLARFSASLTSYATSSRSASMLIHSTIFRFSNSKPNLGVCKFPAQLILSRHRAILTPGYTKLCNSFRFHTNVSSFRLIFICCVSRKNPPSLASNCFSSNLIFAFQFCNLTTILHFHSLVYRGCHLCHLC